MKVHWKEPASNRLYDDAPSNGANLFLLSQVQYSSSLPDDKSGKLLSFVRGRRNKLAGTFDPEAWLRGPGSAVLERELERRSRPVPLGGPGNAEMGAEDDVLLPLALPEGAPTAGSSAPSTPSENPGVASAVPPAADVPT